jgi:hypothetical protein
MPDNPTEAEIEEAQAVLLASLERAHELICEAKQTMRPRGDSEPLFPGPAR